MPGGVRPADEGGLRDTAGLGERGRLLVVAGDEALFLALIFGLKREEISENIPVYTDFNKSEKKGFSFFRIG